MHTYRFPGESPQYREARNELLRAERDLRGQVERVAAMRRKLPPGGLAPQDYELQAAEGPVRLSQLFAPGKDTLVLYGFMYGPDDDPCPMCTSFLDGLNGQAIHLVQRVSLAVAAKASVEQLRTYAASRGWTHLRLVSWGGSAFGRDYHCETEGGAQNSILHTFRMGRDGVRHFWSTELNMMPAEPGQNHRHIDMMWPLWNVLDTTPEGRGEDWYPSIRYE